MFHGTTRRFPGLRFALVENGAGWVPHYLEQIDHAYEKAPQLHPEPPSETFKRHFWMHPFHEEDPTNLVRLLGADRVIFGSDYPHLEGLAEPLSWMDSVSGLTDAELRLVMGGNMINLLDIAA
jgi:predicted TIM-barrel fold metal-dependent hydrolase